MYLDDLRGKYLKVLKEFRQHFPPIGSKFDIIDPVGHTHHDVKLAERYRITNFEKKGDNLNFFVGPLEFVKVIFMKIKNHMKFIVHKLNL